MKLSRKIFFSAFFIMIVLMLSACSGEVVEEPANAKPRELQVVYSVAGGGAGAVARPVQHGGKTSAAHRYRWAGV